MVTYARRMLRKSFTVRRAMNTTLRDMALSLIPRLFWRCALFALSLVYDAWRYFWEMRGVAPEGERAARAAWLHRCCQRTLRIMQVHVAVRGPLPEGGLIVANHLSYLDIVALSAALPCVFVSKMEVADWPLFGVFAKRSGTLFLDRARRGAVSGVATQMREVLATGVPVILFPEGTSTNGDEVIPFKTSLFEPVAKLGCPMTAAAITYASEHGSVRDEIHWWGPAPLAPHLLKVFVNRRIDVTIRFGAMRPRTGDRKVIARELHDEVSALRTDP